MNIAFVIPGGGGGGVRSVLRVAQGLMNRGHQLTIYFRRDQQNLRDHLRTWYHAIRYRRGRGWLGWYRGRTVPYRRLAQAVGRHDVIIGVGVGCVLEIADLPPECGIKVHNCRGVEPWCSEQMRKAWAISMPRIVVGSHLVSLMRQAGSEDDIHVAPNGIDAVDYFPSLPESMRDGVGVVYHGAQVKDPDLLVTVLSRLALARPQLPFYVFGTFPDPESLPRSATYVRFPTLAQARDLYSRSLVWLMTSRNEGFGNPLLEAASCGCALVSTDCGGASDIIHHEVSGLIVPVHNADAMVNAVGRLLDDGALRENMARQARESAAQFTWEKAVITFEQALIAISARARARALSLRRAVSVQTEAALGAPAA